MENFISLLSDVWNRGFYGVNLSDIIISFIVLLAAFLFRGFILGMLMKRYSANQSIIISSISFCGTEVIKKYENFMLFSVIKSRTPGNNLQLVRKVRQ